MRLVLGVWEEGIFIGGVIISNLRYADDTLLVARGKEELLTLTNKPQKLSSNYGIRMNQTKTKIMIIYRADNNRPNIYQIGRFEVVGKFICLDALKEMKETSYSKKKTYSVRQSSYVEFDEDLEKREQKAGGDPDISCISMCLKHVTCTAYARRVNSFEMWC